MHYYQFNIGDYASHTSHLDPIEDIAYRRMIDWYYLHEQPLPNSIEKISKLIRMREHCKCIADVLQEFFLLKDDGYHHSRIDQEIKNYKLLSSKRKKAANKRWATNGANSKGDASALQIESKSNANQEPLTKNHKPLTKFIPPTPEEVAQYCAERNNGINSQEFIDHYQANGWKRGNTKIKDWKACVRTWEKNHERRSQTTGNFNRKESLADREDRKTARLLAELEAEEIRISALGQDESVIPAQVDISRRREARKLEPVDAEFFEVVPKDRGFNR